MKVSIGGQGRSGRQLREYLSFGDLACSLQISSKADGIVVVARRNSSNIQSGIAVFYNETIETMIEVAPGVHINILLAPKNSGVVEARDHSVAGIFFYEQVLDLSEGLRLDVDARSFEYLTVRGETSASGSL